MVVAGVVALAMVALTLVMLDPDRRWTPKLPMRPVLIGGGLRLETCGPGPGGELWLCTTDVDWVSELEVDVDGDQRSDVRALLWDGSRPARCIDLRPGRRFSTLDATTCCCLKIGCGELDETVCQKAP